MLKNRKYCCLFQRLCISEDLQSTINSTHLPALYEDLPRSCRYHKHVYTTAREIFRNPALHRQRSLPDVIPVNRVGSGSILGSLLNPYNDIRAGKVRPQRDPPEKTGDGRGHRNVKVKKGAELVCCYPLPRCRESRHVILKKFGNVLVIRHTIPGSFTCAFSRLMIL